MEGKKDRYMSSIVLQPQLPPKANSTCHKSPSANPTSSLIPSSPSPIFMGLFGFLPSTTPQKESQTKLHRTASLYKYLLLYLQLLFPLYINLKPYFPPPIGFFAFPSLNRQVLFLDLWFWRRM
jgi:hypothetical protein